MMKVNIIGLTQNEKAIIKFLLDDYIALMQKDLSGIELTIYNDQTKHFPMTCPKRMNVGQREDYIIYLCHKPDYWCQMVYQLAHELGHFFMKCYPEKQNLKWIDECMCEFLSLIFLSRSVKYYECIAPTYVEPAKNYIREVLQKTQDYSDLACSDLIAGKISELESDPTEDGTKGRPRNCYIAAKLYEMLGYSGKGISAFCLFYELFEVRTSEEFFDLWLKKCRTADEMEFVSVIRQVIGI